VIVKTLLLLLISLSLICGSAEAHPSNLRVKLFEMRDYIDKVEVKGPLEIISPHIRLGNEWIIVRARNGEMQLSSSTSERSGRAFQSCTKFVVQPLDNRGVRIRVNANLDRAYIGKLVFTVDQSKPGQTGLKILNEIPTTDYVASVVGSETSPYFPPEALKAVAVLVNGIVEKKRDGEVVGDSTREQAYKGCEFATPRVIRATKSVLNKRLLYKKSPIQPFFHSTCAGGTSSGEAIFGEAAKPLTYLQSVKCVYCTKSPFWKTKTTIVPAIVLEKIFDGGVPVGTKYDSEKRPTEVIVQNATKQGQQRLSGYEAMLRIGRARGWGLVPSTRFRFQVFSFADLDFVRIQSSGAGHGVGLCQWGAAGLAERGKTCDEILKFYFPGCQVVPPNPKD
jgi:SpoIID/LytB domain protein